MVLSDISVDSCFDLETVSWYQDQFARRNPEHDGATDHFSFLLNWNFLVELGGILRPTRAAILLFGTGRFVRQVLPRPVLDYQRIDTAFENWSAEQRWHDRFVFEENILKTWQGLISRYMRVAEHPFSIDPATLRRNDDPPDYVAFREAAINLLIHQDYGDHGRKASIKIFSDRVVFWNPGDAFATEAELLDPTEKEVRNPSIVKAFRRIGLSDQAGTGIRAIFRNWHELGRFPPLLKNDKARKDFELILPNSPLISNSLLERLESLGLNLTSDQIGVVALALLLPADETLSLTSIRSLGTTSTREARELADQLIANQVLELVGTSHFRLSDQIRVGVTPEVTPELARMLSVMTGKMSRAEIMAVLGLRDEKHFRENYQQYGINEGLIEMTLPDTPRSSKQRYRLTDLGKALRASTKGQG